MRIATPMGEAAAAIHKEVEVTPILVAMGTAITMSARATVIATTIVRQPRKRQTQICKVIILSSGKTGLL